MCFFSAPASLVYKSMAVPATQLALIRLFCALELDLQVKGGALDLRVVVQLGCHLRPRLASSIDRYARRSGRR